MSIKSQELANFKIPTYHSEESIIRTKISVNTGLTKNDIETLKDDIKRHFKNEIIDSEVINYLNIKYPGIKKILNLQEFIKSIE